MLTSDDFYISQEKLKKINELIEFHAEKYGQENSAPADVVSVTFEFSPLGSEIFINYDSGPREYILELDI